MKERSDEAVSFSLQLVVKNLDKQFQNSLGESEWNESEMWSNKQRKQRDGKRDDVIGVQLLLLLESNGANECNGQEESNWIE